MLMSRLLRTLTFVLVTLVSAAVIVSCAKSPANDDGATEETTNDEHPAGNSEHPTDSAEHPTDEHPADSTQN